jgi:primosomal protein N' (replication factor Y)
LNADQWAAEARLEQFIEEDTFNAVLLHGVTGSGKTEVYMQAIEKVLRMGRQALVLVPEIALTPQTVQRFMRRFTHVAVLHSGLTNLQRHQQWRMIADGQAQVVVGARSAVFAPLERLGLIVVDEEHEPSYKQDTTPRYHGRDVAIKLAQLMNIPIILGSATPSLETFYNCQARGHFHLLTLPCRVMDLPLPSVAIVDMQKETGERKGNHLLSRALETELGRCLAQKRQAILLLNRRGHSNFVYCPSCKYILHCPNCDVSLTYHKAKREFDLEQRCFVMCHYCLHSSLVPKVCPVCAKKLILIGPGTQKAEEEVTRKFPSANLCRVDSDSMKCERYNEVMMEFAEGKLDILLGTQMIGKGLDFPKVTLVGVLNADSALSLPDFRSSERTFQLIAQVAGRCGRASSDGRVIVQTYLQEEPAVNLACKHDYETFARLELQSRKSCAMPPYHRMARIILRDSKLEKLESVSRAFKDEVDKVNAALQLSVQIRGPIPATIARIENYHRWQIILKSQSAESIQKLLHALRQTHLPRLPVQTVVDVDPVNLL